MAEMKSGGENESGEKRKQWRRKNEEESQSKMNEMKRRN